MTPTRDIQRIATPDAPIFAPPADDVRGRGRRWARRLGWLVLVLAAAVVLAPRAITWTLARGDVAHSPGDVPRLERGEHRVAIVLGAGLVDKRPSPLLADRIEAAVRLLEQHRVDLLLMSGDNTTVYYDEPSAMRRAALEDGVPVRRVAVDYAGRRTWDTCVRAKQVFGIDDAVVVTNAFHVDRALVSCRAAGIDAVGMSVDDSRHGRANRAAWRLRELAATGRALVDAWWLQPAPAVGGAKIDPYEPCEIYDSLAPSVQEEAAKDFRQFNCD
jgi:vancomycin permeability regulator SanA